MTSGMELRCWRYFVLASFGELKWESESHLSEVFDSPEVINTVASALSEAVTLTELNIKLSGLARGDTFPWLALG
ncbi:hypothetical protein NVIRENTERO_03116 [Sodalis praecaptivus]|nr:hypothetical protein NVIRENTERO_03116 [Sodalis praecaptivus]